MVSNPLEKNHRTVLHRVAEACAACGRAASDVHVVAVTKKVSPARAEDLVRLGCLDLGENRVPELERKATWFRERSLRPRWHFIGHLQRNKARRVVQIADELHAVDSRRLVETLLRVAAEEDRHPGVYLQVKLTAEERKHGLSPAEIPALVEILGASPLPLRGLMTMAAPRAQSARFGPPRAVFRSLRLLADSLPRDAFHGGAPRLSMGMSEDLEDAIREGAHVVRVGSALFQGLLPDPAAEGERTA